MLRKDIKKPLPSGVDAQEIAKFNAMASAWRDPQGAFRVVHAFNKARLAWLQTTLAKLLNVKDFKDIKLLDAGCATGLVSERFAQVGAIVTGIDAAERNIEIARQCAQLAGLDIDYQLATPEEYAQSSPQSYDLVFALEVVEHVADLPSFLDALFRCVKPDGLVVIATLNRTWLAWLLSIVMAEYVLGWLPKGTHDWRRFVTPKELDACANRHNFSRIAETGLGLKPWRRQWATVRSLSANYMVVYRQA